MDVFGKAPTSDAGNYFRNNVWWWRPLAMYICDIAPAIAANCQHWQTNDGDGLGAADAMRLADVLQVEIDSGRTKLFQESYADYLRRLPDEVCPRCSGEGRTPNDVGRCPTCNGHGSRRPMKTSYNFDVANVQEFVDFLRSCGGFEIR